MVLEGALIWLLGYAGAKTLDAGLAAVLGTQISRELRQAADQWANSLPDTIRLGTSQAQLASHEPDVALDDRPAMLALKKSIEAHNLPGLATWFEALLEQWRYVHSKGEGYEPFFRADEKNIVPYLELLAEALHDVCSRNADMFRKEVIKFTSDASRQITTIEAQTRESHTAIKGLAATLPKAMKQASISISGSDDWQNSAIEDAIRNLTRFRLHPDFRATERVRDLAVAVTTGSLSGGRSILRAKALGWAIRILSQGDTRGEAEALLAQATSLPQCDEIDIASALLRGDPGEPEVLAALANITNPLARSAALISIINAQDCFKALEWLHATQLEFASLEPTAQALLVIRLMEANEWQQAFELIAPLSVASMNDTPALSYAACMVLIAITAPADQRHMLLYGVPFEPEMFTLADTAEALTFRRKSIELAENASQAYSDSKMWHHWCEVKTFSLWLRLRSSELRESAIGEIQKHVRDVEHGHAFADLALRFGAGISPQEVKDMAKREEALRGELRPMLAMALVSAILTNDSPSNIAAEIASLRPKLEAVLSPFAIASIEIQALCKAGRIAEAQQRIQALNNLPSEISQRFERLLSEASGEDIVASRKAAYAATNTTHDLELYVEALEKTGDIHAVAENAMHLFERTKTLNDAAKFISALDRTGQEASADAFLDTRRDLALARPDFVDRFAQALYMQGRFTELLEILNHDRLQDGSEAARHLYASACIETGRWHELDGFVQLEYNSRDKRSGIELLRAAQYVLQTNPGLSKRLVEAAVDIAPEQANVLANAFHLASGSGWENQTQAGEWLRKAMDLSGEDGPLQQADLRDIIDRQPDWRKHEKKMWEGLTQATYPIALVGDALNRTLVSMTLSTAFANRKAKDARSRVGIPAYQGGRDSRFPAPLEVILVDPTALLSLADLGLLQYLPSLTQKIVLPHGTMTQFFINLQKAAFHQPSQVHEANNLIEAVSRGQIKAVGTPPPTEPWLIEEAGHRLAALISACKEQITAGHTALVVHPGVVTKATSLGEEAADLRSHTSQIIGCQPVVDFLYRSGGLTGAERERILDELNLRGDNGDESHVIVEKGSLLFIDGLALSYLSRFGIISRLSAAGVELFVHSGDVSDADGLVRYNSQATEISECIEEIRKFVENGINSGLITATAQPRKLNIENESATVMAALDSLETVDAYLCDDRALNAHHSIGNDNAKALSISSIDIIDHLRFKRILSDADWFQARHQLRTGGYLFVPISADELRLALSAAPFEGGKLVETAELKAIREYIEFIAMTDWLQIEREGIWLNNVYTCQRSVLRELWDGHLGAAEAVARSTWLVSLVDVRDWLRFRTHTNGEAERLRASQIWLLSNLPERISDDLIHPFLNWADEQLVAPTKEDAPEVFDQLVTLSIMALEQFENGGLADG